MEQRLKERLFGAIVLIALMVIFLPMIMSGSIEAQLNLRKDLPPMPEMEGGEELFTLPETLLQMAEDMEAEATEGPIVVEDVIEEKKAWVVQLATFANPENASAFVKKLRGKGFSAYSRRIPGQDMQLIKVFVGPELHQEDADQILTRLETEFKMKGIVVRYRPFA